MQWVITTLVLLRLLILVRGFSLGFYCKCIIVFFFISSSLFTYYYELQLANKLQPSLQESLVKAIWKQHVKDFYGEGKILLGLGKINLPFKEKEMLKQYNLREAGDEEEPGDWEWECPRGHQLSLNISWAVMLGPNY